MTDENQATQLENKLELPERIFAFRRPDGGNSWHYERLEPSDVEYARVTRPYFCSCGGACTAEEYIKHYFELGHDRGESGVPVVPQEDAATKARHRDEAQKIVLATEAVLGERLNIMARHELTDRIAAALDAAPSPSSPVPAEQQKHHKYCSSWTVNTSGERQPCDCVCACRHSMFEHIRPGEHYWYEDCAVEGCPCMKFAAATPTPVEQELREVDERVNAGVARMDTSQKVDGATMKIEINPAATPSPSLAAREAAEEIVAELDRSALLLDSNATCPINGEVRARYVSVVETVLKRRDVADV